MSAPRPGVGRPNLWHFPSPQIFTLDNGVEVWAFQLPGQLVLNLDVLLPAPICAEPRALEGVATLAVRLADEGTLGHPGPAISAALEDQAASFGGNARPGGTVADLQVPATRLTAALGLFTEVLREPSYAQADVERHRQLRLTEIKQTLANPAACAALAFDAATEPAGSRLGRPTAGTSQTVSAISRTDLQTFHDEFWHPAGSRLIVAGELPEDLPDQLNDTVGTWRSESTGIPDTTAQPTPTSARHVWIVDMPSATQTAIRVGRSMPGRKLPEWPALQVAGAAVGGVFNSRLNQVLREQRGYTYGAHAGFGAFPDSGVFTVQTSCRNEVAADATALILGLLDLETEPLTEPAVNEAIDYLIGVAPMRYDTPAAVCAQAIAMAEANMSCAWLNELYAAEEAVTVQSANEAFAHWIDPNQLNVVLAGPAAQLKPQLAHAGLEATVVDAYGQAR
jgi:predicted Zn-dependent peptidase